MQLPQIENVQLPQIENVQLPQIENVQPPRTENVQKPQIENVQLSYLKLKMYSYLEWTTFTKFYSTGVARVLTVAREAFYYRLYVCNQCKLLFQTQFLSNPTMIILYLHSNIPQVNNKCIISYNHLLTCY